MGLVEYPDWKKAVGKMQEPMKEQAWQAKKELLPDMVQSAVAPWMLPARMLAAKAIPKLLKGYGDELWFARAAAEPEIEQKLMRSLREVMGEAVRAPQGLWSRMDDVFASRVKLDLGDKGAFIYRTPGGRARNPVEWGATDRELWVNPYKGGKTVLWHEGAHGRGVLPGTGGERLKSGQWVSSLDERKAAWLLHELDRKLLDVAKKQWRKAEGSQYYASPKQWWYWELSPDERLARVTAHEVLKMAPGERTGGFGKVFRKRLLDVVHEASRNLRGLGEEGYLQGVWKKAKEFE